MPRLAKKCPGCKDKYVDISEFEKGYISCKKCVARYRRKNEKRSLTKKIKKHKIDSDFLLMTREMIKGAKKRAKKFNLPFNINIAYIRSIYPKDNKCPYFGTKMKKSTNLFSDDSPSLDRIDPKKGYVKGNVEIISMKANIIKGRATPEELEQVAKRLRTLINK